MWSIRRRDRYPVNLQLFGVPASVGQARFAIGSLDYRAAEGLLQMESKRAPRKARWATRGVERERRRRMEFRRRA